MDGVGLVLSWILRFHWFGCIVHRSFFTWKVCLKFKVPWPSWRFHILIDPYRSPFWLILDDTEKISMSISNFFRYQRSEDSALVCRRTGFRALYIEEIHLGLEP